MSDRSINLEKAIEDIDKAVFATEGRHLSDAEEAILHGAGQSKNYDEIAEISSYKSNYLRGDVGPKLWKLLTEALGEKVSMRNFQEVLERRWGRPVENAPHLQESIQSDTKIEVKEGTSSGSNFAEDRGAIVPSLRRQKWSKAPNVSVFYGRKENLDNLEKWIIEDGYKVLAILGMPGIGKTFLATKLAHKIEKKGYTIIWRSLDNINTPLVENLLADLIECLSSHPIPNLPENVNDRISLLISYLQNSPCLLVIDNWNAILKEGNLAGQYEDKYKDYGKFLRRLGEESHKSCLVITSREKPKEIALLEGETPPVRAIELKGLGQDARLILQAKGLRQDEKEESSRWEILIRVYKGNPLALELISPTIKEVFDGSVSAFITDTGSANLGDFSQMLEALFERLSSLEKDILYWLAIKQELQIKDEIPYLQALAEEQPKQISLNELRKDLLQTSQPELYAAIKSLRERSLIEKGVANYTLQPVVWEYVRNKFVEDVCQEIQSLTNKSEIKVEELKLLKSHALNNSPDKSNVKQGKSRPILVLIKERLYAEGILSKESSIIDKLKKIKSKLEGKTRLEVGYAPENMSLLIEKLSAD